jgi:hypothetical protein
MDPPMPQPMHSSNVKKNHNEGNGRNYETRQGNIANKKQENQNTKQEVGVKYC